MSVNLKLLAGQLIFLFLVFSLILFLAAGTIAWPAGWAFLILFFSFVIAITAWLYRHNPGLLTERMTGQTNPNQKRRDTVLFALINVVFIVWLLVMPLDAVRFRWSHVPTGLQVVGAILLLCSFYLFFLTFRENSFLSPAIRIQTDRGQTVISTGPYHTIRHPMYAAALIMFVGTPLLLGSWYGLLVGAVLVVVMARRAVLEETTLKQELQGYDAYMGQVKYRLVPYIW